MSALACALALAFVGIVLTMAAPAHAATPTVSVSFSKGSDCTFTATFSWSGFTGANLRAFVEIAEYPAPDPTFPDSSYITAKVNQALSVSGRGGSITVTLPATYFRTDAGAYYFYAYGGLAKKTTLVPGSRALAGNNPIVANCYSPQFP